MIAAHFFEEDAKALDTLQGQLDEVSAKLEELAEENGGEDGLFAQLDDLKKATISARIKAIKKIRSQGRIACLKRVYVPVGCRKQLQESN
ncbi:MAG: hypothetical protein V8R40_02850 [Dysosmobacter sp.]